MLYKQGLWRGDFMRQGIADRDPPMRTKMCEFDIHNYVCQIHIFLYVRLGPFPHLPLPGQQAHFRTFDYV